MDDILSRFSINCHSSIRYAGAMTVWFDPFRVADAPCDADVIFVTHDHYDHFSPEEIRRVMNPDAVRVLPEMVEKYDVKERLQMDYAPRKIAVPQGGIRQEPFRVERQHLDGNHHVNNGQYISMAMAYLPENFAIRQMRAEYKKSALIHDIVVPIIVTEADRVTVSLCSEDEAPFVVVELTGR